MEINLVHDLRERKLSEGILPDFLEAVRKSWEDHEYSLPGCESSRAAKTRFLNAIIQVAKSNPGRRIGIASHGNVIGLLLNSLDPGFGFEEWKKLKNPQVILLDFDGENLAFP